jgi:hypothetical protein
LASAESPEHEFEARFPKISMGGYQNILRRLAGAGFAPTGEVKLLRIHMGAVRAEIRGGVGINAYCARETPAAVTSFTRKTMKAEKRNKYGIKLVFSHEAPLPKEDLTALQDGYAGASKHFRLIHRVTFANPAIPCFKVDCSVIKSSHRNSKSFALSDVLGQMEVCEVEVEAVAHAAPDVFRGMLAKVSTLVLAGIQNTSYPISLDEMDAAVADYAALTKTQDVLPVSKRFLGYNSVTLQSHHLDPVVLNDYVVSVKADGVRRLLYVNGSGKCFLITPLMTVEATNVTTRLRNTLFDGEFVEQGKAGPLNMFAIFDLYYDAGRDVRALPFTERLKRLDPLVSQLGMNVTIKPTFTGNVFEACKACLAQTYPYETDGIMLTPDRAVGTTYKDPVSPNQTITWDLSFKWKPPDLISIDFQVFVQDETPDYKVLTLCVLTSGHFGNPFDTILQLTEPQPTAEQGVHQFIADEAAISKVPVRDGNMYARNGDILQHGMIVEFIFDQTEEGGRQWVPLRVRYDKVKPNHAVTAHSNWATICAPVTERMIVGGDPVTQGRYYVGDKTRTSLRTFHNHVKLMLLERVCKAGDSLFDFATGKGGDISKWRRLKLALVVGLDICADNILNMHDGACVRFLSTAVKSNLFCLFAIADCTKPLNQAASRDVDRLVIAAVLGDLPKEEIPSKYHNLIQHWNVPFQVSSAMFSVHYMHRDKDALYTFARNVARCTKLNGFFVGTAWDGVLLFRELAALSPGQTWVQNDVRVVKQYAQDQFPPDETSLGLCVDVFQSTFTHSKEYLVNFEYFTAVMVEHGFRLKESKPFQAYDHAKFGLSAGDKKLSFLNRTFVFEHVQLIETVFAVQRVGSTTL